MMTTLKGNDGAHFINTSKHVGPTKVVAVAAPAVSKPVARPAAPMKAASKVVAPKDDD